MSTEFANGLRKIIKYFPGNVSHLARHTHNSSKREEADLESIAEEIEYSIKVEFLECELKTPADLFVDLYPELLPAQ